MGWFKDTRDRLNSQSRAEKVMAGILDDLGIKYTRNYGFRTPAGRIRFVDFRLDDHKVFIEVDGPEHDLRGDSLREWEILEKFKKWFFIRFANWEVFYRRGSVIARVRKATGVNQPIMKRVKRRQLRKAKEEMPVDYARMKEQDAHLRQIWQNG